MTQTTKKKATHPAPEAKDYAATIAVVPPPDPIRAAFAALESDLNRALHEREREVRGVLVALLAREHILLLGPAGTGKSALARLACEAIDGASYFQWLLTRFSPPEELFGPTSLEGLKRDVYRRVTTGKLPEAHVVFLDEIYKANSAVLNALLTALNERKFDNDLGRVSIPLLSAVGASNELPEGAELAALHDRFLLRFWTKYTATPGAFTALIAGAEPAISARISMADLAAAQAAVDAIPVPEGTIDELYKLRTEVATMGVVASDRRWRKAAQILRAVAWLEGATEVTPETFPILSAVLWETTDQVSKLTTLVARYTSAELAEMQELMDAMSAMVGSLPPKGSDDFGGIAAKVVKEMKKGLERLRDLHGRCGGAQSRMKIAAAEVELKSRLAAVHRDATEAFGL
jgi:MoxR-like ATPase